MAKSIKLNNNTYWDIDAVRYAFGRKTFNIPANDSITLTFTGSEIVFLLTGKTTLGSGVFCWIGWTYNEGTSSRTGIRVLENGSGHVAYSIDGKKIILTNSAQRYKCSIIPLVSGVSEVDIS